MSIPLPAEGEAASVAELRHLTHLLVENALGQLRRARDFDAAFLPHDPLASDPGAAHDDEMSAGWSFGHIVAHVTATAEESAALAAELARGVTYHGRSRQEVPWQDMTSVARCRARLEECRRMCLASLSMWPDSPALTNTYIPWEGATPMGAVARYLLGLRHFSAHVEQMRDALAQARADRGSRTLVGRARKRFRRERSDSVVPAQAAR